MTSLCVAEDFVGKLCYSVNGLHEMSNALFSSLQNKRSATLSGYTEFRYIEICSKC